MPLFGSFGAACARGLGLGNGEAPRVPTSVSVTAGVITITATYTITVSTFPLSRVEYRIARGGDAGQYAGSLPGANGSNSSGTISTRVTAAGATENLVHNTNTYTIFFRAVDASGQIGPETAGTAFTTLPEVAPTAATPVISSSQVSYPTTPFLSFTWGAGTAGTYSIGTRQYSVVAGNNPGAGTYTTMSGTSGTQTIRSTSNGTAIRAGTQYTVYLKYTSTSPTLPAGFGTAYAVGTTASEIAPSAPNSANLTRNTANVSTERSQIILTPGTITNAPTYNYKFQYALSTSNPPTNWADWPFGKSSTAWTVSASAATTYYLRFRSMSILPDGTEVTASAATLVASVTTRANVPPAPTLAWSGSMSGSSYANPKFSLTSNGGSTSSMRILEPGLGLLPGASGLSSGVHTIPMNYESNGASKTYYAVAVNVDGDSSSASGTRTWVLPAKNTYYVAKPQGTAEYQLAATNSSLSGCPPSYFGIVHSSIPASDDIPGYKRVDYYGFQIKSGGFSNTVSTYLFWTDPAGTKTASLSPNTDAVYSLRYEYLGLGGSSLNGEIKINFLFVEGTPIGSAARIQSNPPFGCIPNGSGYFLAKEFYVEGVQTGLGSVS